MPFYVSLTCEYCLQSFNVQQWELKQRTPRYCSMRCMGEAKRKAQETRQCAYCGTVFTLRKDNQERAARRYCSLDCANKATGKAKARALADRLWSSVNRCAHGEDCPYCCWLWTGAPGQGGYGKIQQGRQTLLVHRVVWELQNARSAPAEKDCRHWCQARLCVNPWHLTMTNPPAPPRLFGSNSGMSKLTEEDIPEIFHQYHAEESSYALARRFHVTSGTILSILHRATWTHVSIPDDLLTLRPKPGPFPARGSEEYRAYYRAWYYKNHEKRLAEARAYKAIHGDRIRAQQRRHKKEWGATHREIIQARNKAQYRRNPAKRRAATRAWQQANPARVGAAQQRRRARKRAARRNDLTLEQWLEILQVFRYRCAYCGIKLTRPEQDHILALSRGGSHTVANIVPACRTCNARKHVGPPLVPVQPLLLTLAPSLTPHKGVEGA